MQLILDLRSSGENKCVHRCKKPNNQELILLLILEICGINNVVKGVIVIEVFWWSFLTFQELEKLQSFDCGKHFCCQLKNFQL
ncbi:hypothetical protein VIGAN_01420900 [Vigna angularis var. angularis]|uniref:Uncharacterized protein n=1 Tax=Vigna angularis var. angularis TaxID=157739 RepID=A0A0S3R6J8_PHAAN|nr:hypothetical protein VIGAN_01420900 [Vigna angularis var. angularis]